MTDKTDLYQEAMKFAKEKASISYVQRKCRCSYNDAERMLEQMVSEGVIGTYNGRKGGEAVGAGGVQALSAAPADPSITLDFKQATELLAMFGGEPGLVTLQHGGSKCHSGPGLYAWYSDMPEEGAEFLGAEADDEASPTPPALSAAPVISRIREYLQDLESGHGRMSADIRGLLRALELDSASPTPPAEQHMDPDGEAFRKAARLGLTLRFYGACAQSGMPGTPSAYVVTHGGDRAEAMREAVEQAAAIIASGGEAPKAPLAPPAEQQAMESAPVDGAASQPPISNTLWRMLTGGYEHTYILQLPNDSRDRSELIDRACHNWRRICAEIGNSAVASAVSPQTAQAPQQAAPKAAPGEPCRTCNGTHYTTLAAWSGQELCSDCGGSTQPAPAPLSDDAKDALADAEYYVDNPSAWNSFDQRVSDAIDRVTKELRAALAAQKGTP